MLNIWYIASPTKFKMMPMGQKMGTPQGSHSRCRGGGLRLKVRCGDGIFWCVDLFPSYL